MASLIHEREMSTTWSEDVRPPNPYRRPYALRLWPLAALGFTTLALATSAFRVVASSIAAPESLEKADSSRSRLPEPPRPTSPARPTMIPQAPTPSVLVTSKKTQDVSVPITKSSKIIPKATAIVPTAQVLAKSVSHAKRIMVRDENGRPIVSRVYGQDGNRVAVLLPDGSIGWPDGLTYTDKPFIPMTISELKHTLLAKEFAGFSSIETNHYLVLYQGSKSFAQTSSALLENLYGKLSQLLNSREVPVHEAEFPMVAIIFRTEDDFRKHRRVTSDVQAYYEIMSNRIFLYENSKRDLTAPEVSALQKPQTVAHEGTHQVLQNIGVQPRLSDWPLWLVEGLAEYCATPKLGKNGVPAWSGLAQPNLPHIATIRDLDDPLPSHMLGSTGPAVRRDPSKTMVEYLVTRSDLSPTDYALCWALTHFLALKREEEFLDFVREMSAIPPFQKRTADDHLRAFKAAFGSSLVKVDSSVAVHVRKLKQIDALPHYAVMFEQPIGGGRMIRRAMVSQSPAMIRQFIENSTSPRGGEPHWQVLRHPSRARALNSANEWFSGG